MKVLFITVRSDFGGGPRHIAQLVEQLPLEVQLYMAYPENGEPYATQWKSNNRIKDTLFIPYRTFSFSVLLKLKEFVWKHQIDIIHSHGNGAGIYSRMLKIIGCKVKIVHTFHGITEYYSSPFKSFVNKLMGKVLRLFTDRFILVSKGELCLAKKRGFVSEEKSEVIYNGIEKLGVQNKKYNDGVFRIVSLSRFDFQKNMDMSLEVARHLKNNRMIQFVWVGNGPDYERLNKQSKDENLNIVFPGFSSTPYYYLGQADVYLSTSRFEGLPYALIEAASIGLPIVATDVVGNNEVVKDNVTGFLITSVDEAVRAINKLLSNRELVETMSKASCDFFESNFRVELMINKVFNIYRRFYESSHSPRMVGNRRRERQGC